MNNLFFFIFPTLFLSHVSLQYNEVMIMCMITTHVTQWMVKNGKWIPSDAMRYDACSSTFSRYLIAIPGWLCDHKVYILIVLSSKHSIIPAWNPKSAGSIPKNYSQSDSHVSIHPSTNACLFCSFIIKPQPLLIRFQPFFLYDNLIYEDLSKDNYHLSLTTHPQQCN